MCYILSSEKLLLNYFATNRDRKSISIFNLNNLASRIITSCENGIIVNTSRNSIDTALAKRSNLFKQSGDKILLLERSDLYLSDTLVTIVNNNIPSNIKEKFISECESYDEE